MFHIVLVHPEIPPNTGNVIRLCANTGARLHLVEPLGFSIDDRQLRRAGLDYHEYAEMQVHPSLDAALAAIGATRVFALSTRGQRRHDQVDWRADDTLLFGSETAGLPRDVMNTISDERWVRLPMRPRNRSLNLSNAVAVTVYEAWRQLNFPGGA